MLKYLYMLLLSLDLTLVTRHCMAYLKTNFKETSACLKCTGQNRYAYT